MNPAAATCGAREAFGRFAGFEIGWMIWLTRISSAAALSNALADAVARFWPWAGAGLGRIAVIVVSLGFLTGINIIGVWSAARTGVVLVIGKMLPLLLFVAIGAFYIDPKLASPASARTRTTCNAWARPRCCCCTPTPVSRTSRRRRRVPQSAPRHSVRADSP